MMYYSTKEYKNLGPVSYRQWRADSHCNLIHGYSLSFKLIFKSETLDARNWVMDFGGLRPLKQMLEDSFDHTLLVAADDPHLAWYEEAQKRGIARIVVFEHLGCEALAKLVYKVTEQWLIDAGQAPRVKIHSVEVREHEANSAIYQGDQE